MAKARKSRVLTEQLSVTIVSIDKQNGTFVYINENGDETEGMLSMLFEGVRFPFDITMKTSSKEDFEVAFEDNDA